MDWIRSHRVRGTNVWTTQGDTRHGKFDLYIATIKYRILCLYCIARNIRYIWVRWWIHDRNRGPSRRYRRNTVPPFHGQCLIPDNRRSTTATRPFQNKFVPFLPVLKTV
jgi:hypothetical protein